MDRIIILDRPHVCPLTDWGPVYQDIIDQAVKQPASEEQSHQLLTVTPPPLPSLLPAKPLIYQQGEMFRSTTRYYGAEGLLTRCTLY